MRKRIITGTFIFIFLLGFLSARLFLDTEVLANITVGNLICDFCLLVIAVIGTFEMTRALKDKLIPAERVLTLLFPVITYPVYVFLDIFYLMVIIAVFAITTVAFLVFYYKTVTIESVGYTLFICFYPSLLLMLLMGINHYADFDAFVLPFVISPFADVFAYFIGSWLKGKKLCPEISPNKTVSGAIGGLIGGSVGGVLVYFLCMLLNITPQYFGTGWDIAIFAFIGVLCSLLTEFGDLIESVIKRKIGIKDLGKLLPGHGGVMDRIDGLLFATPVVALAFCIIIPIV